jgi:hypothetical protein
MTRTLLFTLVTVVLFAGCVSNDVERTTTDPDTLKSLSRYRKLSLNVSSPFLKAHMKDGNLYVFDKWKNEAEDSAISGTGTLFSPARDTMATGDFSVPIHSIAIVETNVISNSGSAVAMSVFTGITLSVTFFCIANPKACFGSCPTFYVSDGDSLRLQGEGFSSSVSPALEATDVDALFRARANNGTVSVIMRNEALETHVVRSVNLLAVPRRQGCRVFASTDGTYWESSAQTSPRSAQAPEGDCLAALANVDGRERFSYAGGENLARKESIDLNFRTQPGRLYGLVVGCRQTLLPTYLLYQTFAYMGNSASEWLANIERHKDLAGAVQMERLIGGIDVATQNDDGSWRSEGEIKEHGPLAVDVHLLPLNQVSDTTANVRLTMTKGAWRIDYVALAELSRPVSPIRVFPGSVVRDGQEEAEARTKILDTTKVLVTFPGDTYTLNYTLPDANADYELFLESRGYYIEWIRKEWVKEENPLLLTQMFLDPAKALKRLAPEFKLVEPQMEECFWRSRYAQQ